MDGERYELFLGSVKIGTVTQTDSDFPSLWGTLAREPWLSRPRSPDQERFARFVALNREITRLLDVEHQVDTSREQAALNAEMEAGFMEYVDSMEWRLVDLRGRELPILCPIFRDDDEVAWRWDPDRG